MNLPAPAFFLLSTLVTLIAFSAPNSAHADPIFASNSTLSKTANAQPVLSGGIKAIGQSSSGFFQDETLYSYAQDQVLTQFWFCTRNATIGTQCVAAPIIVHATWTEGVGRQKDLIIDSRLAQKEFGMPSKITVATR